MDQRWEGIRCKEMASVGSKPGRRSCYIWPQNLNEVSVQSGDCQVKFSSRVEVVNWPGPITEAG